MVVYSLPQNKMSDIELDELDSSSTGEICETLREQMNSLAASSEIVDSTFRTILRKVRHADPWAENLELTPKATTARWLKARGWTEKTIPFMDFLNLLFKSAVALDIETQTLHFKKEEADLFKVDTEVSIYKLLQNLPIVFA
jgi:hypothetical protein